MFGPLNFSSPKRDLNRVPFENTAQVSSCLLCESKFNLALQQDDFLQHLFDDHRLVVADVPLIAILEK